MWRSALENSSGVSSIRMRLCGAALLALSAAGGCGSISSHGLNAEGTRQFQSGQHQVALDRFQRAIAADPRNGDGYYNLAAVYHHLGKANRDSNYYTQAEQYYHKAIDMAPNHAEAYRGLAVLMSEQQRNDEAVKTLAEWGQRSPTSADARVELARFYQELGMRKEAEKQLLDAVAIDTRHSRARAALGMLREQEGDMNQALVNYTASLEANRVQPQVAARVAALSANMPPPSLSGPMSGTRMVTLPPTTSIR
ncbi:MAG: tetratricopeptide repeat protein [Planctomycetes bacterium]|nr:tetratricopeptide repeat protein [Planctomycetota bacterium]